MTEPLLLAAHEVGHIAVSQNVAGIRADDDGWTVLADGPQTQAELLAQMLAGCLAELILLNGEHVALVKVKADKASLRTQIGGHDWFFVQQVPHELCIDTCLRIAPIIAAELGSIGKLGLSRIGAALIDLKPGQTLAIRTSEEAAL